MMNDTPLYRVNHKTKRSELYLAAAAVVLRFIVQSSRSEVAPVAKVRVRKEAPIDRGTSGELGRTRVMHCVVNLDLRERKKKRGGNDI